MDAISLQDHDPASIASGRAPADNTPSADSGEPSPEPGVLRLDGSATKRCAEVPDPALTQEAPDRFLLVVALDESVADSRALIEQAAAEHSLRIVTIFEALGIVEVEGTADQVRTLATVPGVRAGIQALGNVDRTETMATGLNLLMRIARVQRTHSPGDGVYGGIGPGQSLGYPVLVSGSGDEVEPRWVLSRDPNLDWAAPPAVIPVVNLSVGPDPPTLPFVPNDLVNMATAIVAEEMLVVAAAGNCGVHGMSAWACPEWVLAVGATDDAEGTRLAEYSSRGRLDVPDSGPDLVTWGTSRYDPDLRGTSFAAPRVTYLAQLVTAALIQLGREVQVQQGAPPGGVANVGIAVVDARWADIWSPFGYDRVPLEALPIAGVNVEAVKELLQVASTEGVEVNVRGDPPLVRKILISSATPMAGYDPHEVGAGFINLNRVQDRLTSITGRDLLEWFTPLDHSRLADLPNADVIRVFDAGGLEALGLVLSTGAPAFCYDYENQRFAFAPLDQSAVEALTLDDRLRGFSVK